MASSSAILLLLLASHIIAHPLDSFRETQEEGSQEYPNLSDDSRPSFQDRFKDFYEKASEKAGGVWEDAKNTFKSAHEKVKDFIGHTKDKAKETIQDIKKNVKTFVDNAKEKLSELLQIGKGHLKEVYEDVKENGIDSRDGRNLLEGFWKDLIKPPAKEVEYEKEFELEREPPRRYIRNSRTAPLFHVLDAKFEKQLKSEEPIEEPSINKEEPYIKNDDQEDPIHDEEQDIMDDEKLLMNEDHNKLDISKNVTPSRFSPTFPLLPWDGDNADSWEMNQQVEVGNDMPNWRPTFKNK